MERVDELNLRVQRSINKSFCQAALKRELERIAKQSDEKVGMCFVLLQRGVFDEQQRTRRDGVPRAALVGYTNAGKSTLMRALTGVDVLVEVIGCVPLRLSPTLPCAGQAVCHARYDSASYAGR